VFVALIGIAGFLLGMRAGIELGYRRATRRFAMSSARARGLERAEK
jgi:hypothetical protein